MPGIDAGTCRMDLSAVDRGRYCCGRHGTEGVPAAHSVAGAVGKLDYLRIPTKRDVCAAGRPRAPRIACSWCNASKGARLSHQLRRQVAERKAGKVMGDFEVIREAIHPEPIWRARSNFITTSVIDSADTDFATEQLWARKVDESHFELCCIPFFVYDLALGDVVETDSEYMVRRVSTRSGRHVFRVYFGDSFYPREEIAQELTARGGLLEVSSTNLLAVDARDRAHAEELAAFLQEQEDLGHLIYETGKSA